jgi:hypothetical protein
MLTSALSLLPFLLALGSAAPTYGPHNPKAAAYFLDNNPAGSSIVALAIGADGQLSDPMRTATGGKGLYGLTAGMNGSAAMAGGTGMFLCFLWSLFEGDWRVRRMPRSGEEVVTCEENCRVYNGEISDHLDHFFSFRQWWSPWPFS